MVGIIYKVTNNVNIKCYIGQTRQNLDLRWRQHITASNNPKNADYNSHFHRAIRKHLPSNFIVEELVRIESDDVDYLLVELNKLEIHYIKKFDTYRYGYNSNEGGGANKGLKHSDETKKKMSESRKGKTPMLGKKHSTETKNKIGLKGEKHPNIKPVLQFDLDGNFIKEWSFIKDASDKLNISAGDITRVCKNQRNKAGGYKWKYKINN